MSHSVWPQSGRALWEFKWICGEIDPSHPLSPLDPTTVFRSFRLSLSVAPPPLLSSLPFSPISYLLSLPPASLHCYISLSRHLPRSRLPSPSPFPPVLSQIRRAGCQSFCLRIFRSRQDLLPVISVPRRCHTIWYWTKTSVKKQRLIRSCNCYVERVKECVRMYGCVPVCVYSKCMCMCPCVCLCVCGACSRHSSQIQLLVGTTCRLCVSSLLTSLLLGTRHPHETATCMSHTRSHIHHIHTNTHTHTHTYTPTVFHS